MGNVSIPRKLDGKTPYMGIMFIDSYGDCLLKDLTLEDINPDNPDGVRFDEYFMPCAHCGNPVLSASFENGSDCCDRCNLGIHSSPPFVKIMSGFGTGPSREALHNPEALFNLVKTQTLPEDVMIMEQRIKAARQEAEDAFWAVIVKHFPEANDGAFLMTDMEDIMLSWVKHWVGNNVPETWKDKEGEPEEWTKELNLHYPGEWHLHHTGGGCMVVTSNNVVVSGEHRYIGITSECIAFNKDTFNDNEWLQVEQQIEDGIWSFGDNPTVLMNMIDNLFGGACLWDTGKLFDDLMTIGKSKKC